MLNINTRFILQLSDFDDLKEKLKKYKHVSVQKLLKFSGGAGTHQKQPKKGANVGKVDAVEEVETLREGQNEGEEDESPNNETVIEGNKLLINYLHICSRFATIADEPSLMTECDLNVELVVAPDTPEKVEDSETEVENGPSSGGCDAEKVSSQILPLARLSSGGGGGLHEEEQLQRSRAGLGNKLRKTLAEPLLNYLQDLGNGGEGDEPVVLNTPRSVSTQTTGKLRPSRPEGAAKKARNLFGGKKAADREAADALMYANMPPITITDM